MSERYIWKKSSKKGHGIDIWLSTQVHTAHWTLHTTHCILDTAHRTLHAAQCTLHTTHFTLNAAHCTLHNARCTLYAAQLASSAYIGARAGCLTAAVWRSGPALACGPGPGETTASLVMSRVVWSHQNLSGAEGIFLEESGPFYDWHRSNAGADQDDSQRKRGTDPKLNYTTNEELSALRNIQVTAWFRDILISEKGEL